MQIDSSEGIFMGYQSMLFWNSRYGRIVWIVAASMRPLMYDGATNKASEVTRIITTNHGLSYDRFYATLAETNASAYHLL